MITASTSSCGWKVKSLFALLALLVLLCYGGQLTLFVNSKDVNIVVVNNYADPGNTKKYRLCNEEEKNLESPNCVQRNRICLIDVVGDNDNDSDNFSTIMNQILYCGPCEFGYIEFGYDVNIDNSCMKIDSIEWLDFIEFLKPTYSEKEEDQISNNERLDVLKQAATFIVRANTGNRITEMMINDNTSTDSDSSATNDEIIRWEQLDYLLGLTPYSADYTKEDYRSRAGYIYQNLAGTKEDLKPFNVSEYYLTTTAANSSRTLQGGLFSGDGSSTTIDYNTIPDRIDWVELGGVTHVKDQGRCGCCWAVSLSGAIEGGVYSDPSNYGYLQSLSFQQFLSCSKTNGGCDGGNLALASLYAQIGLFKGITRLNDYPYTDYFGTTTEECLAPAVASKVSGSGSSTKDDMPLAVQVNDARKVAGFNAFIIHNERVQAFKEAVAIKPVAMVMKSSCRTLSNYRKGVLTDDGECACAAVECIDHAVLMVGYDDTTEIPYFKMKNSWGTKWGEDGYFRVAQTPGVGSYGLFGILAEGVIASGRNTTSAVEDEKQMSPIRQWWAILLIALASVFVAVMFYAIFRKYFCQRKDY